MKKFLQEFKEFAMRGNMIDMAVGIIIGAAFGKIVSSLVADVIMPPLGLLIGGVDFTDLAITLKRATTLRSCSVTELSCRPSWTSSSSLSPSSSW